jgi:flavin-dependent dehydrogenase
MHDVIVVGARCAGSAVALELARKGHRVLLVDKASFPSDTMSTLYLSPPAMAWLAKQGLLDAVRATGCPSIETWSFIIDDVVLSGFSTTDAVRDGLSPRRLVLDKILVDAAVAAGAELREEFTFEDVVRDGDRVIGIRGNEKSGATVEERARIVVGADGRRSAVARAIGAEATLELPARTCTYYGIFSVAPCPVGTIVFRNRRAMMMMPTNDERTLVYVGRPAEEFAEVKRDHEKSFFDTIDATPELADRVRAGTLEERLVGTADLPNFYRRSHGPGWALAGDAGYHKDPCTAQGISDAMKSAEALARAIDDGLRGARPMDEATAAYERTRDETSKSMFEWTYRTAELKPSNERTRTLLRAVAANQDTTNRFLGLHSGNTLPAEFFHPKNVERILAAAAT